MLLHNPVCITARLMAGVRVGDGFISIDYSDRQGGRAVRYRYAIDLPGFEHEADDLLSGCQGGNLQEGLESLLCFLGACGEAYYWRLRTGHGGENIDLFPPKVGEWAYQHSDELAMLQLELEETPGLIEE
jgi:hypothetical protein